MARLIVKITGLRELEQALAELPKATGKNVLRRLLRKRAAPIASVATALAPDDPATPGKSIDVVVGTQLNKRQRGLHRKMFKNDRASVEMFVGATPTPAAVQQEFGNVNHGPQPFLRPAWDEGGVGMLDGIADDLGDEIQRASQRLARKAARLG